MAGLVRLVGISKETLHRPGGASKLNFWTACKNLDINYIFGILTSRAFDWYMYGSNRRGEGGGWGVRVFRPPPPKLYWGTPTNFLNFIIGVLSTSPVD